MNHSQEREMNCGTCMPVCAIPWWKRTLDLALIIGFSPVWLTVAGMVAVIIRVGSPGPVLFRQRRVGYKGREFTCYKFRTMQANADTESHRRYTEHLIKSDEPMKKLDVRNDPRLIPFGSLLRAGGLDELPQLINVVKGEMSLVGPRPCIRYECEQYEPWHWHRFDALPGLTGLWQVNGKNSTTFEQMIKYDIAYAQRMRLWQDLKILLLTFPALVSQYLELRAAKRRETPSPPRTIEKTA